MVRSLLTACLCAAALAAPVAAQQERTLMPGVTYERSVEYTLHGPVVVHVVEGPRPTGLYALRPVLGRSTVLGKERLTAMEKRLAPSATTVGVNGDVFTGGFPNGLVVQAGFFRTSPLGTRSSLGVDAAGTLTVARLPFVGDWRGTGQRRALNDLNQPAPAGGTSLFTPTWGGPTPVAADAVELVLAPFPEPRPNQDVKGRVTRVLRGGNHAIPPGAAILFGRGNAGTRLSTEAPVGTDVTVRAILPGPFAGAIDGIGGGPILVRNKKPVFRANEAFQPSWLIPRMARTAVGQRADGRILLVTADGGRPGYSSGMTNFELAQELVRLGAVTGMALDAGASSAVAFEGDLLNRPTGAERQIADALLLMYFGVHAPPPSDDVVSPNGDGVAEHAIVSYKLVRPSTVVAELLGPGSARVPVDSGSKQPGSYKFTWTGLDGNGRVLPEGHWSWHVAAKDDLARTSEADRPLSLNVTLKALTLEPAVVQRGGSVRIGVDLLRPAKATIRIETRGGAVLRTLVNRQANTGHVAVAWDGRVGSRRVAAGTYVVRASATNAVGTVDLIRSVQAAR